MRIELTVGVDGAAAASAGSRRRTVPAWRAVRLGKFLANQIAGLEGLACGVDIVAVGRPGLGQRLCVTPRQCGQIGLAGGANGLFVGRILQR